MVATTVSLHMSPQELERSLRFIERTGASDFFPHLIEEDAVKHSWPRISPILEKIELQSYIAQPAYKLIAPKQKYAVRPVHLLDFLDLILYTALMLRLAPAIEKKRLTRDYVHSYRYNVDPVKGVEFKADWNAYTSRLWEQLQKHKMMAVADIVDFFPRIYLHRLENSLNAVTGDAPEVKALMRFLGSWSDGTSYGVPIGPVASNVLAEALLIEVDDFLHSNNVNFMRYVDDFFIFGNSEAECLQALYLLGTRLHQSQGLSVNMAKTRIRRSQDVLREMSSPKNGDKALRDRIIQEVFRGDPYVSVDYSRLTASQKSLITQLDARKTLDGALNGDLIDLTGVRFVLNVLSALQKPDLVDPILDNLNRLQPVSDAVARFFRVFDDVDTAQRDKIGRKILEYVCYSGFVPDYQVIWLLEPFAQSHKWNNLPTLRELARTHKNGYVRRQASLALGRVADRSALLDLRYQLNDAKDWEWRAIVFACRNLPKDERDAFYKSLPIDSNWKADNALAKAIVEYGKANS